MKLKLLPAVVAILLAGQSCISTVTKHSKAAFQVETNTPVKVLVYSHGKKKFVPVPQLNSTGSNTAVAEVKFKKMTRYVPKQSKFKKAEKLRKGEELTMFRKNYTQQMYASGVTEVSGYDTVVKSNMKDELILKFVPENETYKEVIYQVNGQMNKKRKNISIATNLPFLVLSIPFLAADLRSNYVQYDLPKKISFTMPAKTAEEMTTPPSNIDVTNFNNNAVKPPKDEPSFMYKLKTDNTLESMKKAAVEGGDYTTAADIKKEQDTRKAEWEKIKDLQKQLDEKVKAEDYNAANVIKGELQPLKDKAEKKDNLRKEIEAALIAEDYAKAEKLKQDLKALY